MLIGQTLVAGKRSSTAENSTVSTPWIARQGDAVTSSFEVTAMVSADTKISVTLYHRDSVDTGTGSANGSANITSTEFQSGTTVKSFRSSGCKQLVRYEVELEYTGSSSDATVWSNVRVLQPSWETTGAQG